jgi:outer membrane protein assembly factor BamB
MHAETVAASSSADVPPAPPPAPRLWLPVTLLGLYWVLFFLVGFWDKPYFVGFLYALGSSGLLTLLFCVTWWRANRRLSRLQRLAVLVLVLGGGLLVAPLCHPSMVFNLLTLGIPLVLTTWTIWQLVAQKTALSWEWRGALLVVALTWGSLTLIRIDGVNSDLRPDLRWRWSQSAEGLFLAEKARTRNALAGSETSPEGQAAVALTAGDWTEFRGPDRDGVIHGVRIATDWGTAPPRPLWRQRVGPAWSSMIVLGDRLVTQEQRGEQEAVVCYQAATGKELWTHEDRARFWDTVSGAGPRATPTFANGRIYTMGGTGILNCLDAATGKRYWTHDLVAEAGAAAPLWGFSGSPLVADGNVIVFAGGKGEKTLLAYGAASGDLAWAAPAGQGSYSSPQLATLAGTRQCLLLSDGGLTAVDPHAGMLLWKYGRAMPGAPRTAQSHVVGSTELVVPSLAGPGVARVAVTPDGGNWKVEQLGVSTDLKPEFPDVVVHQGHVYGFDLNVFCCVDLATGKRCWRAGRYGRGQVMLLPDQALLLVVSETGAAVLLAANPERHEELGRFQAIEGKTWNHPVIAHGRLYVRNAEEMACYELERAATP